MYPIQHIHLHILKGQFFSTNSMQMAIPSSFVTLMISLGIFLVIGVIVPAGADTKQRAFFVFGDSLVDSGNNNYLVTTARADSPPYGIDYPTGRPTGRFSNGLNIPDLIS